MARDRPLWFFIGSDRRGDRQQRTTNISPQQQQQQLY